MSHRLQNQTVSIDEIRDFSIHTNRTLIAALFVSAILHACFYFGLFRLGLTGQGGLSPNGDGETFQQIGIVVTEEKTVKKNQTEKNENHPQKDDSRQKFQDDNLPGHLQHPISNRPPVELSSPQIVKPILGPGFVGESTLTKEMDRSALTNRNSSRPTIFHPPAASLGETTFFNIKDSGKKYVYLVDYSGSMGIHNALGVAKAELSASLDALNSKQTFRVVFFSSTIFDIDIKGRAEDGLYFATSLNRGLTKRAYSGIRPNEGTRRLDALKHALKYKPDILFFLTDVGEPRLEASHLAEIKNLNRKRTRIHCIEFGEGGKLGRYNFLEKLAKENGGSYTYRDVTKFSSQSR